MYENIAASHRRPLEFPSEWATFESVYRPHSVSAGSVEYTGIRISMPQKLMNSANLKI